MTLHCFQVGNVLEEMVTALTTKASYIFKIILHYGCLSRQNPNFLEFKE